MSAATTFLQPLLHRSTRAGLQLVVERTGVVIATRIEAAFDSASRRRGLLGRATIADSAAVVLAPCSAIHTWFMRFPIDVLFLRQDGRIASVRAGLGAWRVACAWRAFAVIELPAGTAARMGLHVGDRLGLRAAR